MKHQKAKIYDDMASIHTRAMQPLSDLIAANRNFHLLEKMIIAKETVPEFRFKALEEKFVIHMTGVCDIFKLYGEKRIEEHYDLR